MSVVAGEDSDYRIELPDPATVAGSGRVGSPLSVAFSAPMQNMFTLFSSGGSSVAPQVQWLRDGTPIAGATSDTYTPGGADTGATVSAALAYPGVLGSQLTQLTGAPAGARTLPGVEVTRVPSRAFVRLPRPTISAGQHGVARVDVTATNLVVTGKVTLTVGKQTYTRSLRNGAVRVRLPLLRPGRYPVKASYAGTSVFAPATASSGSWWSPPAGDHSPQGCSTACSRFTVGEVWTVAASG